MLPQQNDALMANLLGFVGLSPQVECLNMLFSKALFLTYQRCLPRKAGDIKLFKRTEPMERGLSSLSICSSSSCTSCKNSFDVLREQHRNMYIIKGETDHQPRLDA